MILLIKNVIWSAFNSDIVNSNIDKLLINYCRYLYCTDFKSEIDNE